MLRFAGFCSGCQECPETELALPSNRLVKPHAVLADELDEGASSAQPVVPVAVDLQRGSKVRPGAMAPSEARSALQLAIAAQKRLENVAPDADRAQPGRGPHPPAPKGFPEDIDLEGAPFTEEKMSVLRSMATSVAAELCNEVEHELHISQAEAHFACSGSTSLAMLWGRFFHASDNAAFRSVAMEVSPLPGGDALHFVANLKRRSSQQRFGLECTEAISDPGVLLVTGVERGGCVEAWNDHCAQLNMPWKRLHLCAAILAVNGISGNSKRMRQELAHNMQAVIVACNPPALHDAVTVLRAVRAAAPPPAGLPFWAKAMNGRASGSLGQVVPEEPAPLAARSQGSASFAIPSTPPDAEPEEISSC